MNEKLTYAEIVANRRRLTAGEHKDRYATLSEAGLDGFWVSPPQETSRSCNGPVLVAHNFLDFEKAKKHRDCILNAGGYLPCMPFNAILDCALRMTGMNRSHIYITQALHFLPKKKAAKKGTPLPLLRHSFCKVTKHEIRGRRVIALGAWAQKMCKEFQDEIQKLYCLDHPSARGGDPCDRAKELANVLTKADGR